MRMQPIKIVDGGSRRSFRLSGRSSSSGFLSGSNWLKSIPTRQGSLLKYSGESMIAGGSVSSYNRAMMNFRDLPWSKTEKEIAKKAYEAAYERECADIAAKLREMTAAIDEPRDIWPIQDFLTRRRRETDEKYDYRYSVLLEVFARLIREGWISMADLEGLKEDKMARLKLWLAL